MRTSIKILLLTVTSFLFVENVLRAQSWTPASPNIYFTGGKVGIGTSAPTFPFELNAGAVGIAALFRNGTITGLKINPWTSSNDVNIDPYVAAGNFHFGRDVALTYFTVESGNVGIGTTSPGNKLHIVGNVTLDGSGSSVEQVWKGGTWFHAKADASNTFNIFEDGYETTRNIVLKAGTGNVGIGTTAPIDKFHIASSSADMAFVMSRANGSYPFEIFRSESAGTETFRAKLSDNSTWHNYISIGEGNTSHSVSNIIMNEQGGNVGIGTTSPLAKLHLNNGSVLFDGTTGATPTSGAGTRMMWIPAKGAFRAGIVTGTQWNDGSIGLNSVAFGTNTTASGSYSSAFGAGSIASGEYSTAFITGFASGDYSFATGYNATASGPTSIAFGQMTTASGGTSAAFGSTTTASGTASAAFGFNTTAQSYSSLVVGRFNTISGTAGSWVATDPLFVIGNGASAVAASNALTVFKNGKTLIGNPNLAGFMGTPDGYLLFVQQGILAEKVKVAVATTAYWSDYVFDEKYKLKSIEDLESFVKTNKHLPNIPSAEEVVKDGIDMATMDAKLLEKIEELSLYIIQQNKRIEALEKKALYKK